MGLVVIVAGVPESTPTGYHTKEAARAPELMSSSLACIHLEGKGSESMVKPPSLS